MKSRACAHLKQRSLPRSFMRWFDGQLDLRQEITVEQRRHAVIICFRRFSELRGYLHSDMLSVEAIRGGIAWDCLLALDMVPVCSANCWSCRECRGPIFPTREALYADHLYEPFRAWVLGPLGMATGVEFTALDGATMAKLRYDGIMSGLLLARAPSDSAIRPGMRPIVKMSRSSS